jgi:cytosine/uracil/thiamine/allantoin permease
MALSLFDEPDFTPDGRNDHASSLKKSLKKLPLQYVVFELLVKRLIQQPQRLAGFETELCQQRFTPIQRQIASKFAIFLLLLYLASERLQRSCGGI